MHRLKNACTLGERHKQVMLTSLDTRVETAGWERALFKLACEGLFIHY